MKIRLLPTHSALSNEAPLLDQPDDVHLHMHQMETYQAIRERRADVIVHTGMTGDGKSLAGELPTLLDDRHYVMAMYPTNELIRDQKRHLNTVAKQWTANIRIGELNALYLDEYMLQQGVSRASSMVAFLNNPQVLLTNPDIFHYIMMGLYHSGNKQPMYMVEQLVGNFKQFSFDEFHLFDQQQTTAVLTALVALKHLSGAHSPTILLQSATPEQEILNALDRGGLSIHEISGNYCHQEGTAPTGYRTILQGVNLELVSGDSVKSWLQENIESSVLPILRRDNQRVGILFNSVFEALSAYKELLEALPDYVIRHNTGLSPKSMRDDSLLADVILGTATVDIGVDLNINTLIFEAYDGASFKQRLGRLGRHARYQSRNGDTYEFDEFRAVACVPPWIYAHLDKNYKDEMTREEFFSAIDDTYGRPNRVWAYNRYWGWLPAFDLLYRLGEPSIREQYRDIQPQLIKAEMSLLHLREHEKASYVNDFRKIMKEKPRLLEAVKSFRGSSAFTAVLVNEHYSGTEKYQFYDFLRLIQYADFEVIDLKTVEKEAIVAGFPQKTWNRHQPIVAVQWAERVLDEKRRLQISLDREAWQKIEGNLHEVIISDGVNLIITPSLPISEVFHRIRRKKYVMRILMGLSVSTARKLLPLDTYFPLFPFEIFDQSASGVIALGRDALMLDAASTRLQDQSGGGLIV